MDIQCFVLHNKMVLGPFNKKALQEKIAQGEISKNCQLWWKGQKDWVSLSAWENYRPNEDDNVIKMNKHLNWYIEKDSRVSGPFNKEDLLHFLQQSKTLANVRVWKRGEKHKATVYQYNDLTDALGIVQRKSIRAPIVGDAKIEIKGKILDAKVCSISEGGLGLTHVDSLNAGDKVELHLESPLLSIPIHTSASIRYVAPNGRVGVQFDGLNSEALTSIIEYINQFKKPESKSVA